MWEGTWGGVQISCSKNGFFEFARAQRAFGARQVFETIFGHIQNFWQKQILHILFSDF